MSMAKPVRPAARYAIYTRCSSDDQKHKDFSTVDVQEGLNREYVKAKGGTVAAVYKDEAVSGTTLKRKGFQQLLAGAEAKKFDFVIVTYMSRLGRGRAFVIAEYELEKYGVRVEMVKEQFTDDIGGYMGKNMTNVMDGMYAFQVRQWTMTKMEAMVNAGYCTGGYPPFGLLKVIVSEASGFHKQGQEPPKRLIPDPETAPVVRQAFALLLAEGKLAVVRDYLRSVTSRAWTTTSAKHLLTNEVYRGVLAFGQWRNEAAWEPVIDASTWQAVQEVVARIGSERGPRPEAASDFTYYLRGRVHCPHCGCLYTQASHHGRNRRVHYYVCLQHKRRGDCPVGRVNAAHLHETALHFLHYTSSHKTVLHKLIAQSGGWGQPDEAQTALRGQLAKKKQFLDMQIANFVKAVGEGRCSPSIMAALEKAETEQQTVQMHLEDTERAVRQATLKRPSAERVAQVWSRIGDIWPVLNEEEREGVLGGVVQGVTVTGKEEVTLELLPMPLPLDPSVISHSLGFNLERELGAGTKTTYTSLNPQGYGVPVFVPTGGKCRVRIPRPERQEQPA